MTRYTHSTHTLIFLTMMIRKKCTLEPSANAIVLGSGTLKRDMKGTRSKSIAKIYIRVLLSHLLKTSGHGSAWPLLNGPGMVVGLSETTILINS